MRPSRSRFVHAARLLSVALLGVACSHSPEVERRPSGVSTQLLKAGQGHAHPALNDCVRLRYTSRKSDGTLHSSNERDEAPLTQCLRQAMPGLAEALQLMVAGEARRISIPGRLTYLSDDADQPAPHQDLVFELTLLEILKAPETPSDLCSPPANARRTASGLALAILVPGTGERHALPADRMRVRFSGWTRRGELFESTELTGKPASVTRADVAPGVGEGLSLLQIGEKARLWVPATLAFGERPRRGLPAGDLTYDLELLAIE